MNLTGWKYLLTHGYSLDIYGKGNKRVGIDKDTGEKVLEYSVGEEQGKTVLSRPVKQAQVRRD